VSTLVVHLRDDNAGLCADLRYSVFPENNAIARCFSITNQGIADIVIERAASFSVDMATEE
jgi:alpha-galactosidase